MGEYRRGFPSQEIRLLDWPSGRASAMRLMINRLESALNDTLPAQVEQSAARKLNTQIPFILDLTITSGFRQFTVNFSVPPGLGGTTRGASKHPDRQLLFYEIQHATTQAFSAPVILQTPQTDVLIGGFNLGQIRWFRVRVVNTKNQVSPWSETVRGRAAFGRITATPMEIGDVSKRLVKDIGVWQNVFTESYPVVDGFFCAQAHLAVGAIQEDVGFYVGGPAHVQFRWQIDIANTTEFREVEKGGRCVMAAIPGTTETKRGKAPMAFGTFMTPFLRAPGTDDVGIRLQAAKRPGSEWSLGGLTDTSLNLAVNSGNYTSSASLTHWWRLGNDINDIGKDYVGSIDMDQNASGITSADVFGTREDGVHVDFDGTAEYMANIGSNTYGLGNSGSISVWARVDGGLGSSTIIADFNVGTTQSNRWLVFKPATDLLSFRAVNAANTVTNEVAHPTAVVAGDLGKTWFHIVATKDSTTAMTIYVNGVATTDATGVPTTSDASRRAAFAISALNLSTNIFSCAIHSVALWSTVLSAAEVSEIFSAGHGASGKGSDPLVFVRNAKVIEVVEGF